MARYNRNRGSRQEGGGEGAVGEAPLGVTVVVVHQTSPCRKDCNPLEGAAGQGIECIPRVTFHGSSNGPDIAEGKYVVDAQLGAV